MAGHHQGTRGTHGRGIAVAHDVPSVSSARETLSALIVERLFGDHRSYGQGFLVPSGAMPGGEHRATGWLGGCEAGQAGRPGHVVVDGVDATAHEVRLVPEAGTTGVLEEVLPPLPVRLRTSPPLQAVEVAPVLPHADVNRNE